MDRCPERGSDAAGRYGFLHHDFRLMMLIALGVLPLLLLPRIEHKAPRKQSIAPVAATADD
jgi:hypothetical protein